MCLVAGRRGGPSWVALSWRIPDHCEVGCTVRLMRHARLMRDFKRARIMLGPAQARLDR